VVAETAYQEGFSSTGDLSLPPGYRDRRLTDLLEAMLDEAGEDGSPSQLAWGSLSVLVQLHLLRARGPAREPASGGLAPWQVKRLVEHMEAHLDEDVPLSGLATLVGLSPFHLCRTFKASLGLPPHRWLQARRVERAKALLSDPVPSIIDVAAAVGYENPGHFAKIFRRETGVTPREFRRGI
jgi:AraC family transcriptional regulator